MMKIRPQRAYGAALSIAIAASEMKGFAWSLPIASRTCLLSMKRRAEIMIVRRTLTEIHEYVRVRDQEASMIRDLRAIDIEK
jgi:hypothetical protein